MPVEVSKPLNNNEKKLLAEFEDKIAINLKAFVIVYENLALISEKKLYREYGSFENYLRDKWGISRKRAYDIIPAIKVNQILSPMGDTVAIPENERQARPLVGLEPELVIEAAKNVKEASPEKPNNKDFEAAAQELKPVNEEFRKTLKEQPELSREAALEQAKQKFNEPIIQEAYENQVGQPEVLHEVGQYVKITRVTNYNWDSYIGSIGQVKEIGWVYPNDKKTQTCKIKLLDQETPAAFFHLSENLLPVDKPEYIKEPISKAAAEKDYEAIKVICDLIKNVSMDIASDSYVLNYSKSNELPAIKENLHGIYTKLNLEAQRVSKIRKGTVK